MGAHATAKAAPDVDAAPDAVRAMNGVRAIVRALHVNARAIEVEAGISLAQLFVLQQLAERPADSLNDLAERTSTHQSSVSVVVSRLVDRDLVTRDTSPVDKRRIEIALTRKGRAMMARAPRTVQADLVHGLNALSARERRTLANLLERWLAGASISLTSPPMFGEDDLTR